VQGVQLPRAQLSCCCSIRSVPPSQFWTDLQPLHAHSGTDVGISVSQHESQSPNSRAQSATEFDAARHLLSESLLTSGPDNRAAQSPFSIGQEFFAATAPAGFTSVPASLLCVYAFRKTFLNSAAVVGKYKGMLGFHSPLLFMVTLTTLVFFFIPLGIRYLLFYRYFRSSSTDPTTVRPCIQMLASHSICKFSDPMSDAPALDWIMLSISFFSSYYFLICTNIIVGTSLYKVVPVQYLHPLPLQCSHPLTQWRRLKLTENFIELLCPQASHRAFVKCFANP
jgi:hypothetical protein